METVIKCKQYKSDDLLEFGKDIYFKIGLDKVTTIKMSPNMYNICMDYLRSLVSDCKKANVKLELSYKQTDEYINVYYQID